MVPHRRVGSNCYVPLPNRNWGDRLILPLRAVLIGDKLPDDSYVIDRIEEGDRMELFCSNGNTIEAPLDEEIFVEQIAISQWDMVYVWEGSHDHRRAA